MDGSHALQRRRGRYPAPLLASARAADTSGQGRGPGRARSTSGARLNGRSNVLVSGSSQFGAERLGLGFDECCAAKGGTANRLQRPRRGSLAQSPTEDTTRTDTCARLVSPVASSLAIAVTRVSRRVSEAIRGLPVPMMPWLVTQVTSTGSPSAGHTLAENR